MSKRHGTTRSSRSAEIRAKWAAHLAAQRASGLRQSDYCREHGVDPKYFSLWKGRLAREATAAGASMLPPTPAAETVAMIPVVLKPDGSARPDASPTRRPRVVRAAEFARLSLHVTLPNGVALGFDLSSLGALPGLLNELARLPPC